MDQNFKEGILLMELREPTFYFATNNIKTSYMSIASRVKAIIVDKLGVDEIK